MATALSFDYTMGARADSPTVGSENCEVMGTKFQEEEAALGTLALTVSEGSTLKPAMTGEGHGLPSPDLSHGGGFDFLL